MATDAELRLRTETLAWREVEGQVVALDTRSSTCMAINRSGAALWPVLSRGATRGELVSRLERAFGIGPERAAGDVDAFLTALRERDLLLD